VPSKHLFLNDRSFDFITVEMLTSPVKTRG